MTEALKLQGVKELQEKLQKLNAKVANQITRAGISKAAQVVRKEMRSRAPKQTGELRQELRYKLKRDRVKGGWTGKVGPTRKAFYARFIEYGTKAHTIPSPMRGRGKSKRKNEAVVAFGGHVFGSVHHPGVKPKPFLRPAYESSKHKAVEQMKARIWDLIHKEAMRK